MRSWGIAPTGRDTGPSAKVCMRMRSHSILWAPTFARPSEAPSDVRTCHSHGGAARATARWSRLACWRGQSWAGEGESGQANPADRSPGCTAEPTRVRVRRLRALGVPCRRRHPSRVRSRALAPAPSSPPPPPPRRGTGWQSPRTRQKDTQA
mmetsp:Transcript_6934/g.11652  ORF Transcript_6934/g.11652 Transcript_6934/m.11652 type:complete len:152 (+) Transcript_6934:108-563(+)